MHSLEQVVSQSLGLPIHYYALVDYTAIQQAVDAVGGIDITIKSSDPRGLYDPSPDYHNNKKPLVDLPNGTQHINGIQALGLARARGDHYGSYGYASGDFTRTSNQRQIIVSLKDKGMSLGTLANPIKLGELFNSVGANVQTDLTSGNVRRLYDLTKDVPDSQIASAGLTDDNVLGSRTIYGAYVLVPKAGLDDYTDVQAFVDKLEQQ
jgi:LCP family protein required for cell wall assembly